MSIIELQFYSNSYSSGKAWAKDEPESPLSDNSSPDPERSPRPSGTSITHVPSITSERPSVSPVLLYDHTRWKFALPRPRPKMMPQRSPGSVSPQSKKETPMPERGSQPGSSLPPRTRWPSSHKFLFSANSESEVAACPSPRTSRPENLHLEQIPFPSPRIPATLSFNKTPGWDSPWTPRIPQRVHADDRDLRQEKGQRTNINDVERTEESLTADLDSWDKRRKKLRSFLLNNTFFPLVSPPPGCYVTVKLLTDPQT